MPGIVEYPGKVGWMKIGRKPLIWSAAIVVVVAIVVAVIANRPRTRPLSLAGAVMRQDADPRKELPLADVQVSALSNGSVIGTGKSDASGFYTIVLRTRLWIGRAVLLQFRHADYQPLDQKDFIGDKVYVAKMLPLSHETNTAKRADVVVSNIQVRYSIKTTTTANVGSAAQSFEVPNIGNVPCAKKPPCSPDGKWKAATGSKTLDAGENNEFRNSRTSCIAGPCPFTKIDDEDLSQNSRLLTVSARNWSDTATFLVEAEVVHPMVSDMVRTSYPVTFGQALNFTMPGSAEGVTILAEVGGQAVVYPLGPNLYLSWADCNARVNKDQTKVFRCELKPGYRFP
jgi:hypothetical protein